MIHDGEHNIEDIGYEFLGDLKRSTRLSVDLFLKDSGIRVGDIGYIEYCVESTLLQPVALVRIVENAVIRGEHIDALCVVIV